MKELPKAYEPKEVEKRWAEFWEAHGFFRANPLSKKPPYCIAMPPPNVTGSLHMGHALDGTLQDLLIRWKRMCGYEVLWVPGIDHASIATQTVVERHLIATQGKRRVDCTREEFMAAIWKWKEESEAKIVSQIKRLGCSCDWSTYAFTMDETRNRAVRRAFKQLFDKGLIYRGDYLIHWDPVTQTALANDEVEYEERTDSLYFIHYPLSSGKGSIPIATTRPETMLADTAVAVHPEDQRYKKLLGQEIRLPITGRTVPLVGDPFVDPEFGTGAVKITPGHDFNDYEMAQRHRLPLINLLTPEGKFNEAAGRFAGLSVEEARKQVVEALKQEGALIKIEPITHRVGISYRSRAIIQPYLSKQWFVKMSHFKTRLLQVVTKGDVKLTPPHWQSTYFHWIENLREWCISRQLWWGHRIPIWYHKRDPNKLICYDGDGVPPEVAEEPDMWVQDPDVLDTWFSAGLWPLSILGWPEKTPYLEKFYPTATLVTGHDILFFWVARMLLMCEFAGGKPPFLETFIHGLIYGKSYWTFREDGSMVYITGAEREAFDTGKKSVPSTVQVKWEKMSKTKGNIIDPQEIIETYGADAMRMALCASNCSLPQIDLDRRRFEEFKHFANKVWNGARFILQSIEGLSPDAFLKRRAHVELEERWILSRLAKTVADVNEALSVYEFTKATASAYDFFWKELCAAYLEITKPVLYGKRGTDALRESKQLHLALLLLASIRLLHPMAPFITEELFQLLKERLTTIPLGKSEDPLLDEFLTALRAPSCAVAPYPGIAFDLPDPESEAAFSNIDGVVHAVRAIRAEMALPPPQATDLYLIASQGLQLYESHHHLLNALLPLKSVIFSDHEPDLPFHAAGVFGTIKLIVPLPDEMRLKEIARLHKEGSRLMQQIEGLRLRIASSDFVDRAPKDVVEKTHSQLKELERKIEENQNQLKLLS